MMSSVSGWEIAAAPLLFVFRLTLAFGWVVLGLLAELLLFPWLAQGARHRIVRGWSRGLLRLCGVRVRASGRPLQDGAVLWVANHVSWVDIFALNGQRPAAFIAKRAIRRWPVLGRLVAEAGTLFIDRTQHNAVRTVAQQMQARFVRGDVVGLFPEGMTTDGLDVGHFHAGLFEPALASGVPVQAVALRYYRGMRRAPELSYVGDQTLIANLWFLLGACGVRVECEFLPPLRAGNGTRRSAVAHQAREQIRQAIIDSRA